MLAPELYIQEIVDLHRFFQAWLEGSVPNQEPVFARFAAATHPDFTLIGPDGAIADRDTTAAWIRAAHGTRPGFALWTDEHRVHLRSEKLAIVTYREWQRRDDTTTARISTAVLCADPTAPAGVSWIHVHETWIQGGVQA